VSPAGYWVAGAILVLGCGGAVVWFVVAIIGLVDAPNDFARFDVPGSAVVALDDGDWMIYHEYPGANSSSYRIPPSVDVTGPTGRPVSVRPVSGSYTYDIGGHDGVAIYEFTANDAGSYTIDAQTVGEPLGRGADGIAIGRPMFGASQLGSILGSMGLGGAALVIGLIVLIVTIVRRGNARRARRPPIAPYGAPAYGLSTYGQPAPYGQAPPSWPPPQPQAGWPPPVAQPAPPAPSSPPGPGPAGWPPPAPPFTPPTSSSPPQSGPPPSPWTAPGSSGDGSLAREGSDEDDSPPPSGPNPPPP
jgi:hypothetical protein